MNTDPLRPEFWKDYVRRRREKQDEKFLKPQFWDRLSERYDELETSPFYRQMVEEIIETMKKRGALSKEVKVFDVACGPGNYAVRFAPLVKKVVGLDVSPKMIERFRQRLEKAGYDNYEAILADWFYFQPQESFETVFVSMSPILHDLDSVDRLLALAKRFLVLVHWAGVRENELHQRLVSEVLGKTLRWKKPGIIVVFNYLYTLGYAGDLKFYCGFWERKRSPEEELDHLLWRLEGQGIKVTEGQKREFKKRLEKEIGPDGLILSRTRVRIGFLFVETKGLCRA